VSVGLRLREFRESEEEEEVSQRRRVFEIKIIQRNVCCMWRR
jgi:hypothetical protein